MKSSLYGPLILLIISSSVAYGLGSVVKLYLNHIRYPLTWETAQSYCRSEFTDLATIYAQSDINDLYIKDYVVWIGLHYNTTTNKWIWLHGDILNIDDWKHKTLAAHGNCAYVKYSDKSKIYVRDCRHHLYFICRKNPNSFHFIQEVKTWSEAQQYCRDHYDYLAVFSSSDLDNVFVEQEFQVWIGVHRDGASWGWSWENSEYRNWLLGEPSNNGSCGSISSKTKMMSSLNCGTHLPSICITDTVILIKEKKSWEEALEHCRGLRSPSNSDVRYDFLSLQPEDQLDFIMRKIMQADTQEVWTGLRFLAGDWLWVNGADMLYTNLPLCPALGQHCGILSKNGNGTMEARDCSERKNFLCYSYKP